MKLDEEGLRKDALQTTRMLKGKTVDVVRRHRNEEICIQFTDGTTLFVDQTPNGLDFSITYDKYPVKRRSKASRGASRAKRK